MQRKRLESRGCVVYYQISDPPNCNCFFLIEVSDLQLDSTAMFTLSAIRSIAQAEKMDIKRWSFFELAGHKSIVSLKPGQHEFMQVTIIINGRQLDCSWSARSCPSEILDDFQDLLGNPKRQSFSRTLA